ncbi:DNA-binding protein [Bosea sp. ASV33]|uniref:DNA-binding protein n=1 Tax=Bosea sp. ASV33 TaxID=2795106 RepID=UPI0018ECE92B|nr:DNA-binding protein [Bosea sp. ASV33]
MPTKAEVWMVADTLRAKGEIVSIRTVRRELTYGGSYRDIGPHLATWKATRIYQPGIELAGLPAFLQTTVAQTASDMWEAAMQVASKQLVIERQNAVAGIAIEREIRDEALAAADKLELEISYLRRDVERLTAELSAARS